MREYTFLLKIEAKAVYSCLSFSLGRATGTGPVENMDAFLFLQLTYKGHVVRIFRCALRLLVMFGLLVVAFEPH